jgi:excisionase family DNA binding protein
MEKLLLKPEEVGPLIGFGRSKVYELLAADILPSVRVGRRIRVPAEALRKWVEERTQPGRETGEGRPDIGRVGAHR